MAKKHLQETKRLALQDSLDAEKTQPERNKLGQFATPTALALDILREGKRLVGRSGKVRFLDPAIGTGSFYSAMLSVFPDSRIQWAKGFEIDSHYGTPAVDLWAKNGLEITIADFTRQEPPDTDGDKASLVVCNPPYVRHHHLGAAEKAHLNKATLRASGVHLNGLTGLYCHFLCLSHAWLADGAVSLWLIPSEFMDVNYGAPVKEYLLHSVTLERIHRFDPTEAQFGDAIVSSAVVCFRNSPRPTGHLIRFTYGGALAKPRVSRDVSADTLDPRKKWTGIPLAKDTPAPSAKGACLSDLFHIRRGLATGANGFFVIPEDRAAAMELPSRMLRPILPSPRYLDVEEIDGDKDGMPKIGKRLVLLDCDLAEADVQRDYPSLWAYLQEGIAKGVNERYLCKHRQPWYSQENRDPAPFLCTYMGRHKEGKATFRFILNHSMATAANVYLLLYPKPRLARAIGTSKEKRRQVWEALCSIDTSSITDVGRVYGGGLHKVEPKELANAPAQEVLEAVPEAKPAQGTLFSM
jgi:hypothetical protein